MTRISMVILLSTLLFSVPALGQDPPNFFKDTYPEHALKSMVEAGGVLMGESAALDAKTRELIGLAVAAQIPCVYCIYVHEASARAAGASEAEVREAVATAAYVRHWSTVLNGMSYDFDTFKAEVDKMLSAQ